MVQVEIKLIPPDKGGKLPVIQGDTIWWLNGVPYKFEVSIK